MSLQFAKHEKLSLREHPDFSEAWLQECIRDAGCSLGQVS
jgi:hypothetical protein